MQRMAWTDERLEERFNEIDRRFDEIDRRFDRVEGEIVELRREMRAGFDALQSLLNRAGAGIIISLMGVIAAVLLRGA
jgi:tetrahydromethanopterin S-methyltransferase subunit G